VKLTFNWEYETQKQTFKNRLAAILQKAMKPARVVVVIEPGRKYDKLLVGSLVEKKLSKLDLKFFIDRKDGSIYGVKSPVAPNTMHYYGTIYTADLWDWTQEYPIPYDAAAAGVVALPRTYGEYVRYAKLGSKEAKKALAMTE